MYTLLIQEYATSEVKSRDDLTLQQAYKMAQGGFYKSQVVNEFGVIEYEFKGV